MTSASLPAIGSNAGATGASFEDRVFSTIIDCLVLVALIFVAGGAKLIGNSAEAVPLILALLYYPVCERVYGQTLGKRLRGLKLVSTNGGRPGILGVTGRHIVRLLTLIFKPTIVGILVWYWLSGKKWPQDALSGTRVVRVSGTSQARLPDDATQTSPRVPVSRHGRGAARLPSDPVALAALLDSDDAAIRRAASEALFAAGEGVRFTLIQLFALGSPRAAVQAAAVIARFDSLVRRELKTLFRTERIRASILAALVQDDSDAEAMAILFQYADRDSGIVNAIRDATMDENPYVSDWAKGALQRL
jgi:uncharacterized RDD family membrane protein YckC